jgi:hypothetical protein
MAFGSDSSNYQRPGNTVQLYKNGVSAVKVAIPPPSISADARAVRLASTSGPASRIFAEPPADRHSNCTA